MDLALPEEMVQGVECFKRFFEISNKHRKLTWMYALGTAHLRGSFDAKPIELVLTTFQAAILLLFNEGGERADLAGASQAGQSCVTPTSSSLS